MVLAYLLLLSLLVYTVSSYQRLSSAAGRRFVRGRAHTSSHNIVSSDIGAVPAEIQQQNAVNDMVLVERFSLPDKSASGIFIPIGVGKDSKRIGRVLSVPSSWASESKVQDCGPDIGQVQSHKPKVGDVVYVNDPWGVGPLDIEVEKRCFSFHKSDHITAVVS